MILPDRRLRSVDTVRNGVRLRELRRMWARRSDATAQPG
jgi:hypothetical protein